MDHERMSGAVDQETFERVIRENRSPEGAATITEEPILVENVHEPLVSMELSERAQRLLKDQEEMFGRSVNAFCWDSATLRDGCSGKSMQDTHLRLRQREWNSGFAGAFGWALNDSAAMALGLWTGVQ